MNAINLSESKRTNPNFLNDVIRESGENLRKCYVCGKCSAGCPVAFAMDIPPNRIAHMVQLGLKEQVLNSRTIWICATCSTCGARCPKGINLAAVMDTLRIMSYKEGGNKKVKAEVLNHNAFMKSILKHGLVYELGYIINLKLGTGKFLQDVDLGPGMLLKGKLPIFPHKIKGTDAMRKIAEKVKRMEGEH